MLKFKNSLAYRRDGEKEDIMKNMVNNNMVNIGISMPEEAYKQIFTSNEYGNVDLDALMEYDSAKEILANSGWVIKRGIMTTFLRTIKRVMKHEIERKYANYQWEMSVSKFYLHNVLGEERFEIRGSIKTTDGYHGVEATIYCSDGALYTHIYNK